MSNVRPWFRLSSIARPTSQGSTDPPPPQPPRQTPSGPVVVTPPMKQPSPPSPPRQPPAPPRQQTPPLPPPQERSTYHSPSSRHTSPPTPIKTKSPLWTPPRSSYTPPPSPKEAQEAYPPPKPTSPPSPAHSTRSLKYETESFQKAPPQKVLSPYTLPPSERETTQKNILTAVKTSQPHEPNHHDHQGGTNNKNTHHQQFFSESKNLMRTRVITIAGENKGAVMEIIQSPSSNKTREGTHSSVTERRVQSSSSISEEEEGKKEMTKNHNNNMNLPMKAFMNSNVQMINNSIVYNSTATHHDPGIHLKVYRKPPGSVKDYGNNGGGYTN